jgi:ATP-dependent protease ClpP protease subunit
MSVDLQRLASLAQRGRELARAAPRAAGSDWFRITNADDRAKIYLFGVIGDYWGEDDVTAAAFVKALDAITAPTIELRVNSPGGLVFDGVAIYTALSEHPARVEATVDGMAASAASFVVQAADSIAIQKPAWMAIHDAQGITMGGPAEHREMTELLDELSNTIAGIYTDRAGKTVEHWRSEMGREARYTGEQAVAAGLADRVAGEQASAPDARRGQMIRARARVALGGVSCR